MEDEEEDLFKLPPEGDLVNNVRKLITTQEAFLSSHSPARNAELMHQFLGFHLGILGKSI